MAGAVLFQIVLNKGGFLKNGGTQQTHGFSY